MLTSRHEQKQSRDGVYCDAESTGEINAPISSHGPSSLCFTSGAVKFRSEHAACGKTVKEKKLFASISPGRATQPPLCSAAVWVVRPVWSGVPAQGRNGPADRNPALLISSSASKRIPSLLAKLKHAIWKIIMEGRRDVLKFHPNQALRGQEGSGKKAPAFCATPASGS